MSVLHSIQDILSHANPYNMYTNTRGHRRRRGSASSDLAFSEQGSTSHNTSMESMNIATQATNSIDSGISTCSPSPVFSPVCAEQLPALAEESGSSTAQLHCGRYRVLASIQKGSTGSVYLGQDPMTHDLAAIKHIAINDSNRTLVQREIELQAYCDNHPNIARVYSATDNGDSTVSIAMEYMPGGDLIDLVSSSRGGLPLGDVLRYGTEIAQALSWMHSLNIAHRDLKCENVCIAADGSTRLIDFGQAHRMDQTPRTRQAGTKNYMAPECWVKSRNTQYDMAAADAWSFGVLVYCLLTARFPWAQATDDNYDYNLFATGCMSKQLASRWVNLPPVARVLLEHLLVVEPSRRWNMATVCAYLDMANRAWNIQHGNNNTANSETAASSPASTDGAASPQMIISSPVLSSPESASSLDSAVVSDMEM